MHRRVRTASSLAASHSYRSQGSQFLDTSTKKVQRTKHGKFVIILTRKLASMTVFSDWIFPALGWRWKLTHTLTPVYNLTYDPWAFKFRQCTSYSLHLHSSGSCLSKCFISTPLPARLNNDRAELNVESIQRKTPFDLRIKLATTNHQQHEISCMTLKDRSWTSFTCQDVKRWSREEIKPN